ncbi:hypothetical protein E1265_21330 [Streptomyces sp. 8K308]|uniref:hypothetical protein n=1 Tax=Streptomyces sp. 8K308 TaxID=2530388 RepID=UPI0010512B0A|nr:hypothetical protein [Streptomyces sp. 8K308]TDC20615.1 hypothetical protein E1265_21330 [Streptomyces sp. 8K308]
MTTAPPRPADIPATFLSVPGEGQEAFDVPAPPAVAPAASDPQAPDPDAPYGRKADGTPKAKPGRKGAGTGSSSSARSKPRGKSSQVSGGSSANSSSARSKSTSRPAGPDYRAAVLGLFQLPGAALALAGAQRPELLADAIALDAYAPAVADAVAQLAREQPAVAAILDRFMRAGPYGALIGAVAPLVLQLLANHRIVKPGLLGTMPPDVLVASVTPQGAAA